ncbi:MAG: uroporphyrinogen decarboxylase family protein [Rectinemataceae bacterium]|jgi:uroporphyrinogen decarboxylase
MTPKERVHAALRREPVDRVPVFMWYHPQTARRLADLLEVPASRIAAAMGDDVRMTWVNNNYAMEGIVHEHEGESHVDEWGIRWVKEGAFNQPVGFPLAGASRDEMLAHAFPEDRIDFLLGLMRPVLEEKEGFFIGCDVSPCVFEMYWRLRGMENALIDMAGDPELTRAMFAKCAHFALELSRRACAEMPLDWLWCGDDVAGQDSMIMSPGLWRDMIKPLMAELFAAAKERHLWVAHHCCGALRPIIPDLIEIGLDLLNPIQSGCAGMDPLELKREFGESLAFIGGVDTQALLPFGTAVQVRTTAERLLEGMTAPVGGRGAGGYILAASHTIPPETPDENIFALYAAAGITREEIFERASAIRNRIKAKARKYQ